jgi:hypothetical protein
MMILVIKNSRIINIADPFPTGNPEPGVQPDGNIVVYVDNLDGLTPHDYIRERYWDGTSLQVRPPPPSKYCIWTGSAWIVDEALYLQELRFERDRLLFASDWTQLPDAPLTTEQVAEATTYRQALRDMTDPVIANPQAYINLEDAPWPTPPSFLNVS